MSAERDPLPPDGDVAAADDATSVDLPTDVAAERERELAVIAGIQNDLAAVDAALERIDDGSYGTCEICGASIADEALAESPAVARCSDHPVTRGPAP